MQDAYKASSVAKYNIGGFPMMSLAGIASTIVMLMWAFFYFTIPELAIAADPTAQMIIVSVIVFSLVIFLATKLVMRSRGIDFRSIYDEIPPE